MISNVRIEQSELSLRPEEVAIIEQFRATDINVTQLCGELGKYGLQVVRITDSYIRLQMDVDRITISFEVEL